MRYKLILYLILHLFSFSVFSQTSEEKTGEFMGIGAVTAFHELCLKVYSDHEKSIEWMNANAHGEYKTKLAEPYRNKPNDRVFLVGGSLAQFVVSFGEKDFCSIYASGVDRIAANNTLDKLMAGYAEAWKTQFTQTANKTEGNMTETTYAAVIPGTETPILALAATYWEVEGEQNSLIKISGISLKRRQTFNTQRNTISNAEH